MSLAPKPIIPNAQMTLYERQQCGQRFLDQVIKGLNPLMKGTGWKRKSAWVFKVEGDWYLTAFLTGGTTSDGMSNLVKIELGIKPMAVDPIHWRALGLHDNLKKPPSFRSSAAWKVPALPVARHEQSEGLIDVAKASQTIFHRISDMAETALEVVALRPFSQIVTDHEDANRYNALHWAALIVEGQGALAIQEIGAYFEGDETGSPAAIITGYQQVIEGADAPADRRLSSDIYGNPNIVSEVSRHSRDASIASPTLLERLVGLLRTDRK